MKVEAQMCNAWHASAKPNVSALMHTFVVWIDPHGGSWLSAFDLRSVAERFVAVLPKIGGTGYLV